MLFPKPIASWDEPADLIAEEDAAECAEWPLKRQLIWIAISTVNIIAVWLLGHINLRIQPPPWYLALATGVLAGWFFVCFAPRFQRRFKSRARLFPNSIQRARANRFAFVEFKRVATYKLTERSGRFVFTFGFPKKPDVRVFVPDAVTRDLIVRALSESGLARVQS